MKFFIVLVSVFLFNLASALNNTDRAKVESDYKSFLGAIYEIENEIENQIINSIQSKSASFYKNYNDVFISVLPKLQSSGFVSAKIAEIISKM